MQKNVCNKKHMKKSISLIIVFVLAHFIGLLQSCDDCNVGPDYMEVTSYDFSLLKITGIEMSKFGTSSFYTLEPFGNPGEERIKFYNLAIEITPAFNSLAQIPRLESGLITYANACDPAVRYDDIVELSITSSQAFDDQHQAGDNLSDLVYIQNSNNVEGGRSIASFLDDYYEKMADEQKLLLTFKRPPSSDLSHDLTIKIALSNGAVFEEELMDIEISH